MTACTITATSFQLQAAEPRESLFPKVREHMARLGEEAEQIGAGHREGGDALAQWLAANYQPGKPLHVLAICTGNSRRSMFTASMGNFAAAYHGLAEITFRSAGTAPSAINSRTIRALNAIGVEIQPTGEEAKRGPDDAPNPKLLVRWGKAGSGLETVEFSKHYSDPSNAQQGFAAILVCSDADKECPIVRGAAKRIPLPFNDPKAFDGQPEEEAKYAERRDDIGRLMMLVMKQVREKVDAKKTGATGR